MIRISVFANWCLSEAPTLSQDWEIGALSFLKITFHVGSWQVFKKQIPECKTGKGLGDDLHLKGEEGVLNFKFSKVTTLRKEG